MPSVTLEDYQGPYRFQFWSSDVDEPAHVHVRRDRADAKYWLEPVELARNHGFKEHELTRIQALVVAYRSQLLQAWMNSFAIDTLPSITNISVDAELLVVHLDDGRILSVPISWYPRLEHATEAERSHWTLFADGQAVEWPELDEHIGIDGLIAGRRS